MNIRDITTTEELRLINPTNYKDSELSDWDIRHLLEVAGALWIHDHNGLSDEELRERNDLGPHAGLSAGGCSTGFLDMLKALSYTPLAMLLAQEHARRIIQAFKDLGSQDRIDWVIGSDHAAATYSSFVAYCLCARHDFTEKGVSDEGNKLQNWLRHVIGEDEVVLQVEELSTTMTTPDQVRAGVEIAHKHDIKWAPVTAFAINRSGKTEYRGTPIVSLLDLDFPVWESPEVCPLCAAGSMRIAKPKLHWAELTGAK